MVLGGEDHILHTGILEHLGPLFGVKVHGVEYLGKPPVPLLVAFVGGSFRASNPVFVADVPGFYNTGNAVEAPMHENAKLEVLPGVQFFQDGGVCGPFVAVALLVYKTVFFLGRCCQSKEAQGKSKKEGFTGHSLNVYTQRYGFSSDNLYICVLETNDPCVKLL